MEPVYIGKFARFILLTAFIVIVAGCGSSGSSLSSPESSGTGSIATKLTWSSSGAKTAAKTLFAAPAGVVLIKIFVYDANMTLLILPKDFNATPGADGSGTIDGIPVGTNRTIKAQGLDSSGILRYQGSASGITVNLGSASNPPVAITMQPVPSVTTASPAGGTYTSAQSVTLTASDPATIYYTTNGDLPTTGSTSGPSPVQNIQISGQTLLQFFSVNTLGAQETPRIEQYFIVP